jgi:hypothetical protein
MKKPNKLILRKTSLRPLDARQLATVEGGTYLRISQVGGITGLCAVKFSDSCVTLDCP